MEYAAFVAPGMLAASAMNGAVMDSTFSIFFKLKFEKLYDAVLATPLRPADVARGEITWALLRGGVYSAGFLLVMLAMGLVDSWWALLAVPATLVIGFGFSAICMALTTYMRSWQDFEFVQLAIMPMFLFSATFFPVTAFDGVLRWVVEATPLYRGVVLCRELTTGAVSMRLGDLRGLPARDGPGRALPRLAPARQAAAALTPGQGRLTEHLLVPRHVDPLVELVAHLAHVADLVEAAPLVQPLAAPGWAAPPARRPCARPRRPSSASRAG